MSDLPYITTCTATAHDCQCGRVTDHPDPHECEGETCRGQWTGTAGTPDFVVVRWPMELPLWLL